MDLKKIKAKIKILKQLAKKNKLMIFLAKNIIINQKIIIISQII